MQPPTTPLVADAEAVREQLSRELDLLRREKDTAEHQVKLYKEHNEAQKTRADGENMRLRSELAEARSLSSKLEHSLQMERASWRASQLERDRSSECAIADASLIKPLQRDLASRNKELATAQADNIQSQEDLTEVIRKATKLELTNVSLQMQISQMENKLSNSCAETANQVRRAEAVAEEAEQRVLRQEAGYHAETSRLQHRIGSLEEQLFAACSPKPAAAALQLSTPTNAPPELLPTSPELSKVELQVEALKAQLHAEEERCTELLKRTLASEAHQEEAQHRVADIESAQKTELSALQASLCQAHVDLKRISVAKAECESSLAQFGAREQQRFKQLDCDLRVCNEKEKAAVQEAEHLRVEKVSASRASSAQAKLLESEQKELAEVTCRRDELERQMVELRLEADQHEDIKNTAVMAVDAQRHGAEERSALLEMQVEELDGQINAMCVESMQMKTALAATLKACEKTAAEHATRVHQLEAEVEKARHRADTEVRQLESKTKELQFQLTNAHRESAMSANLQAEQAAEIAQLSPDKRSPSKIRMAVSEEDEL